MRAYWKAVLGIVIIFWGTPALYAESDVSAAAEVLREKIENLGSADGSRIQGQTIMAPDALARFYEQRFFRPAWAVPSHVRSMIAAIREAEAHGLTPNHYHLQALQRFAGRLPKAMASGSHLETGLDILLTDSFFRLAHDLSTGRVDPSSFNSAWNFRPNAERVDITALLTAALADGRIRERLNALAPSHPLYRRLKKALERYRRIAAEGGWPFIPEGPLLETGVKDARVSLLRQRLNRTGDLSIDTDGDPLVFEPALARAVLRFQERTRVDRESALVEDDDGSVGEATLEALNVPVAARIIQLRVNLERCRWLFHDQPSSFVLVDMASYRGYLFKDDEIIWRARVQVGAPYLQTPSFRSAIKYVVFNPVWTVPPGILSRSVLPKVRKNLSYLEKHHMQVFDRDGRLVDPSDVEWGRYSGANLPYRIVQSPGTHNAVGRVKFIFPNKHFIFLHDTPHKSKFGLNDRAFSAGCIRVDKPFKLAKRLLNGQDRWTIGRIRDILATNETQTVFLPEPMPVMLIYLTARVDNQGQAHFRKDIYKRDGAVIEALDRSMPPVKTEASQSAG
jgi:murein L,D-transpeptidase YcbB/YkuD